MTYAYTSGLADPIQDMGGRRYFMDPSVVEREMRRKRQDDYKLIEALRPTTLNLLLTRAKVITPDPVLVTYKGKTYGAQVRFPLHLGPEGGMS